MKHCILIFFSFLLVESTFAACAIDNTTVCSINNFKIQNTPINQPITRTNVRKFSKPHFQTINNTNNTKPFGDFTSSENNSSYNSSCQFGVCLQTQSTPSFQQPKQ